MKQYIGNLVFYDASRSGSEEPAWVPGIVVGLRRGDGGRAIVGCKIQWLWTTHLQKMEKLSWWEPYLLERGYYSMWSKPFSLEQAE
jgi:hypothetical protein